MNLSLNTSILYTFFILTLLIGYVSGKKIKNMKEFSISHKSYTTPMLVATIFATVIGGGSTFGIVEKTYHTGFIYTFIFMGMAFNRILVGHFFASHLSTLHDIHFTLPSLMNKYYGREGRILTAVSALLVSIGSVGTQTFTIGFILNVFFGFSAEVSIWLGCGILITYSSFGGMRSVIATDVFQFLLILLLIPTLLSSLLPHVGGFSGFIYGLENHFFPRHEESTLKLLGLFFSFLLGSADPSFLQRLLVAKDHRQAREATIYTGYFSLLFYLMMGAIGVISFLALPGLEGRDAFIQLIGMNFSPAIQALIFCGFLAAVMSSADSDLNMVGISVAEDLMPRKNVSEKHKLLVARLSTFVLGSGAVFVAQKFNNILDIIIYAFSFWAPSVLIPLGGCFMHYKVPKKWMVLGVVTGFLVTQIWNLYMTSFLPLEGIVMGMIVHVILFAVKAKRIEKYDVHY